MGLPESSSNDAPPESAETLTTENPWQPLYGAFKDDLGFIAWADHYWAEKHRIHDNENEDLIESFFDLPAIDKNDPDFIAMMAEMRAVRELDDDNPAYTINW